MAINEEARRLAEEASAQGNVGHLKWVLRFVRTETLKDYTKVISARVFETTFRHEGRKRSEVELDHQAELLVPMREWHTVWEGLATENKNPCARICGEIAKAYGKAIQNAEKTHRNAVKAFKRVFGVKYEPKS